MRHEKVEAFPTIHPASYARLLPGSLSTSKTS